MNHITPGTSSETDDYDVNVRMIAFAVSSIVLILVIIFFIKTYVNQKQDIIYNMHTESEMMESFCSENINHIWYIIHLLAAQIKKNPHDAKYVKGIFKDYAGNHDVIAIFGWTEFTWLDHALHKKVSSLTGIHDTSAMFVPSESDEKISYRVDAENNMIYTTIGLNDDITKHYIGSVVVSFDLLNIVRRLNTHKKHCYANVAVIGENLGVVVQSNPNMENVGLKDGKIVSSDLITAINKIGFVQDTAKAISYLDVMTGRNYYVKKVKDLPFVLLINIDDSEIRHNIFRSVATKFIEISIVAACFLLLIIFIYRRETWLRTQAEVASEIATRATNAKSDFLAFTAHEIRSPLGFILTGSEMMKKQLLGPVPSSYREYTEGIHVNAKLILEFITDILDEAHIMAGNFKIVNNPANIGDIILNSVAINQTKCEQKNIIVQVQIAPNLPLVVCDARRILQVLNNLLSNAVQYSFNDSRIQLIANIEQECLYIEVIDQGVGMTEEELNVAFAKYGTVRKEYFNFIESYGLGLPIVKMILDAHNATLIVKTKVNIGTSFKIIFPKNRLDDAQFGNKAD